MSCSSPVTPQSSSSAPRVAASARIEASTARQWRRRLAEETHSQSRSHASARERGVDMAVTLAQRLGRKLAATPPPDPAPPLMEKFVIDGGVPLSGTVTPAGNKNGALPILAASVLTTD